MNLERNPERNPERVWAEWLDAVESAARSVEQQALVREVPQQALSTPMDAMPGLPMPRVPWPASLEPRRREVLATLAAVTKTVERCRDETGAALSRLGHAPARPARAGYADGAAVDVLG
jgi:hypothetical protein